MPKEKRTNFSTSPTPPNWPNIISLKITSPVAAPNAADSGSNKIANVKGIKAKYSTDNSTIPN